jgi:hypothetical protein
MTFYADTDAAETSPFNNHETCPACGEPSSGSTVGYVRVLFHRDCAFAMAQRIICDAWPNRRAGEWMRNDQ